METLYNLLAREIREVHPNFGFERVNSTSAFPYITYRYVNARPIEEGDIEDIIIEIDVWSQYRVGVDAVMEIEGITKQIEDRLKKKRLLEGSTYFSFELLNKLNIRDEDTSILRRQLRLKVRRYS